VETPAKPTIEILTAPSKELLNANAVWRQYNSKGSPGNIDVSVELGKSFYVRVSQFSNHTVDNYKFKLSFINCTNTVLFSCYRDEAENKGAIFESSSQPRQMWSYDSNVNKVLELGNDPANNKNPSYDFKFDIAPNAKEALVDGGLYKFELRVTCESDECNNNKTLKDSLTTKMFLNIKVKE
ncbi:MAG: hypothetical protein ACK41T_10775, partial [Pseudobdellovibrio sp.]